MTGLAGRSAVVTGGASGMGRAIARTLAGEGVRVVVSDVDVAGGEETVALVEAQGGTARFLRTDVSRTEDVRAVVDLAVQAHGGLILCRQPRCLGRRLCVFAYTQAFATHAFPPP